jgi:hypothetical protein
MYLDTEKHEGYVMRIVEGFHYRQFNTRVAKWVRSNHVQTHGHWMRETVKPNHLRTK